MPFEIWIMRHASAEDYSTGSDAARRLTAKGHAEAKAQGRELKKRGLSFQAVVVSGLVRAGQTADEVMAEVKAPFPPRIDSRLVPGSTPEEMLDLIRELAAEFEHQGRALLVGHNPSMGELRAVLLGNLADDSFPKAAVAAFAIDAGATGVPPLGAKQIAWIGKPPA